MKGQYIVGSKNKNEWLDFYSYLLKNFNLKDNIDLSNNKYFPFVVDFDKNSMWISSSITCNACASQANKIISVTDLKKIINERK